MFFILLNNKVNFIIFYEKNIFTLECMDLKYIDKIKIIKGDFHRFNNLNEINEFSLL